jgi:hypothetical protein
MECQRPQIYEFDLRRYAVPVRDGKGAADRIRVLAESLKVSLQDHLRKVKLVSSSSKCRVDRGGHRDGS